MKSSLLLYIAGASLLLATVRSQAGERTVSTNCPLQGPVFPAARNPGNTTSIKDFQNSFAETIADFLAVSGVDNQTTSFSIGVFSGFNDQTLIDYHYAAPGLNGSLTGGVLDRDTIYRIGSVSKLFTAYAWFITSGFKYFEDPITNFIPELEAIPSTVDTSTDQLSWKDITVGALLSHMAGTPRDFDFGDFANVLAAEGLDPSQYGLPTLNASEIPACGVGSGLPLCSRADYFTKLNQEHPIVQPFGKTIYSNIAYSLIGYAFENITGLSFDTAFNRSIVDPLGLTRTSMSLPTDLSNAIIPPGNDSSVMFYLNGGNSSPAGGLYTSSGELAILGRSILNGTLLSRHDTRRWMKPLSFTSENLTAVGAPWEIYRYDLPLSANTNSTRIIDFYTKQGAIGAYSAILILDVDHNMGFSTIAAGEDTEDIIVSLSGLLSTKLATIFEDAAREEAGNAYMGTYNSADSNSNITISLDDARPGLGVTAWFSNGVDFLQGLKSLIGEETPAANTSVRLYPTQLGTSTRVGFRAVFEYLPTALQDSLFSSNCFTWAYTDAMTYGSIGLDDFVFEVGCNGVANAVSPRGLRSHLERTD